MFNAQTAPVHASRGGLARSQALSPQRRAEIAALAAKTRWEAAKPEKRAQSARKGWKTRARNLKARKNAQGGGPESNPGSEIAPIQTPTPISASATPAPATPAPE